MTGRAPIFVDIRMKAALLLIFAVLVFSGCDRAPKATKAPAPAPAAPLPLPSVAEAEVPPPSTQTVRVDTGMNLGSIAEEAYGHEKFSGFVARFNGIEDPEKVVAGTMLKTPALPAALREAGLDARYQPAINVLAKAWADYREELPGYLKSRQEGTVTNGTFAIPQNHRDRFLKCADAIEAAKQQLEKAEPPHQVPRMTADQFAQASSQLRQLASGAVDGYDYDSDLIGQRMGLGFTNALIWVQDQHR